MRIRPQIHFRNASKAARSAAALGHSPCKLRVDRRVGVFVIAKAKAPVVEVTARFADADDTVDHARMALRAGEAHFGASVVVDEENRARVRSVTRAYDAHGFSHSGFLYVTAWHTRRPRHGARDHHRHVRGAVLWNDCRKIRQNARGRCYDRKRA